MTLSFLGYTTPVPVKTYRGYYVPFGVVTGTDVFGKTFYEGYNVFVPYLNEDQLNKVVFGDGPDRPSILPFGDYSSDLQKAIAASIRLQRAAQYPPADEYTYAVASNDTETIASFEAAVAAVNAEFPLPPETPYAVVYDYLEEDNSGPKSGFRPCLFFNLDKAVGPTVDVTVSGDITLPAPGTFSYTATGVDPTQPLAAFLAAVVAGLGVQTDVYFGVERDDTCLAIVGQLTYEIDNVQVTIA
jgi:hypothetical protein